MSPWSRCQIARFRLPLRQPIIVAGREITDRHGALIRLTLDNGRSGAGEITPLPGLHAQSLDDLTPTLKNLVEVLPQFEPCQTLQAFCRQLDQCLPSLPAVVRNGIEMAFWNAFSNESQQTRTPSSPSSPTPPAIPVCALVTDQADRQAACTQLIQQGFGTLKVKVGRGPIEDDLDFLTQLGRWCHDYHQSLTLRLDANRAWSVDQARQVHQLLGDLPLQLDYIEEPLQDADHLPELVTQTGLPIGVDEALVDSDPEDAWFWSFAKAVIIKPAVVGGFARSSQWIHAAQSRAITPVLSSCFESGVAVVSYADLAASHGLHHIAQGLDTLKFLDDDLPNPRPTVVRGSLSLQHHPLNPARLHPWL